MKFPPNPDFLVFFVNTSLSPTDGRYHDCTHIFRKDEDAVREYLAKWHPEYKITKIEKVGD